MDAIASYECKVVSLVKAGDDRVATGESAGADFSEPSAVRRDLAVLRMANLGDDVFYGG